MEQYYKNITNKVCPNYPRPAKFSDPGGDFSDEELNELVRIPDNELSERDLICIFQGALPAGDYHEVMYFLPIALQHIACGKEHDTAEYLLRWISCNRDHLRSDDCYDDLLKFFEKLFTRLTAECVCDENHLRDGSFCVTLIDGLNEYFEFHGDLFLQKYLLPIENYVQAAWMLYFLEHHYTGVSKSDFLKEAACNYDLQQKIYDLILKEALKDENILLFWDQKLQLCGII